MDDSEEFPGEGSGRRRPPRSKSAAGFSAARGAGLVALAVIVGIVCFCAFAYLVLSVEPRQAANRPKGGPGMAVAQPASYRLLGMTYRLLGTAELMLLLLAITLTTGGAFRLALGP